MSQMFLLFSHKLTEDQIDEAENLLNVVTFKYMDKTLQKNWSNVPAEESSLSDYAGQFIEWLKKNAEKEDFVLIQGDFGLSFIMVNFCFKNGLIPVYSTTKRESKEISTINGQIEKTLIFKHKIFRRYENE